MRNFLGLILLSILFTSCENNPVSIKNEKDSTGDTTKNNIVFVDTIVTDTVDGSIVHYDCSVLNRRIPNDSNAKQIQRDLQELAHCGIDSFDFLYVVPNLFPGWWSENEISGNKKVTYSDFLIHLKEFKTSEAYAELHQRVLTLDSLKSIPFDSKKVYAMKPVLGKLGFTEPEWQQFQGFSRTYPVPKKGVFTWGDMIEAFDKYKPE